MELVSTVAGRLEPRNRLLFARLPGTPVKAGAKWVVVSAAGLLIGLDLGAAPERQWGARGAIAALEVYQRTVSPVLARSSVRCRFEPTCSHYAVGALRRQGLLIGGARAVWRVLRCAPWTPAGTIDPP